MAIWRLMSWQKLRKSNYKNNLDYEDEETQSTKTTIKSDSQNLGDNRTIKIIIDEPTKEGVLDFQNYSQNLANIIIGTIPQFAIGIFGKWGTGKTSSTHKRSERHD
jgi:KAP-like P-loop domain-containing protein